MALPTLSQVYTFDVNNVVVPTGVYNNENRYHLNEIKDVFVALGWAVWGSSNAQVGEFGNGDGSDHWGADPLRIAGYGWMVLENPVTGVQVCFRFGSTSNWHIGTVTVSLAGTFGTAAGGTDGTETARPTATVETTWSGTWGANFTTTYIVHGMISADKRSTRVISNRNSLIKMALLFEDVASGIPQIARPVAGVTIAAASAGGADLTYAGFNDIATNCIGTISGDPVTLYISSEGQITSALGEQMTFADDDTGEWPMPGMGLYCVTGGHRGRKGTLRDMWWGSVTPAMGTLYPLAATAEFIQFGHMIFPWNGAVPRVA